MSLILYCSMKIGKVYDFGKSAQKLDVVITILISLVNFLSLLLLIGSRFLMCPITKIASSCTRTYLRSKQ